MNDPTQHEPGDRVGPYDTEQQATADCRVAYAAAAHSHLTPQLVQLQRLHSELTAAGVDLGEYDRQTLDWLGGWPPELLQVIIGIVARARTGDDQ